MLLAEGLNKGGDLPQLAPGQPREEMMLNLKLQATMKPIHPGRAIDIECPSSLLLKPVVPTRGANIDSRREVVQTELNMLNTSDRKASNHKGDPFAPVGQARNKQ